VKDRLSVIKDKRKGKQLLYKSRNKYAEYGFDLFDADEDFDWMLYEIEKLRNENAQLQEFISELKRQMEQELKIHPKKSKKSPYL